jgi:hypothetical protein
MLLEELARVELLNALQQFWWRLRGTLGAEVGRVESFERTS